MRGAVRFAWDARGVARVTLNRPARGNAFDADTVQALGAAWAEARERRARVLVLAAEGRHFCTGADLAWMQQLGQAEPSANAQDARQLADMLEALDSLPCVSIACVQGLALGGGAGLLACCDLVLAAESAAFAFSEVRLGLVAATIAPYVRRALGERACRRYLLSGERFDAPAAQRLGLVHQVVAEAALAEALAQQVALCLQAAPGAVADTKALLAWLRAPAADVAAHTSGLIAARRASLEGQQGLAAGLARRLPPWAGGQGHES